MNSLPDRCSDAEFERRHRLVREEMGKQGIDCLLCYGTEQGWSNVFYLTNHWDMVSCYLILPLRDKATLFTGVFPHLVTAKQNSVVRDVRFGGPQSVLLVVDELRKKGFHEAVIGLVEPDSFRLPGIPHKDMGQLKEELTRATFVSATRMIEHIRRRKSDEEIELLGQGAQLTDKAFSVVVESIHPGVTERDLAQIITGSIGDTMAVLIGSTSMSNPSLPYPSIRPSSRELRQGDVVLLEISLGCAGYAGQVLRTVTLGPPTERYEELYAIALRSYEAICRTLREGCNPLEIVEAARSITDAGLTTGDPLVHGFGLGVEPGLHVGPKDHAAYWPPSKFSFSARSSVTVEPNPCTLDMQTGVVTGDLVIVCEDGCEQLHKVPRDRIIKV
jgi:Xaa-Pro aminopeptidase